VSGLKRIRRVCPFTSLFRMLCSFEIVVTAIFVCFVGAGGRVLYLSGWWGEGGAGHTRKAALLMSLLIEELRHSWSNWFLFRLSSSRGEGQQSSRAQKPNATAAERAQHGGGVPLRKQKNDPIHNQKRHVLCAFIS
jgi:hypothetical protein